MDEILEYLWVSLAAIAFCDKMLELQIIIYILAVNLHEILELNSLMTFSYVIASLFMFRQNSDWVQLVTIPTCLWLSSILSLQRNIVWQTGTW